jgi:hypothetical protein
MHCCKPSCRLIWLCGPLLLHCCPTAADAHRLNTNSIKNDTARYCLVKLVRIHQLLQFATGQQCSNANLHAIAALALSWSCIIPHSTCITPISNSPWCSLRLSGAGSCRLRPCACRKHLCTSLAACQLHVDFTSTCTAVTTACTADTHMLRAPLGRVLWCAVLCRLTLARTCASLGKSSWWG